MASDPNDPKYTSTPIPVSEFPEKETLFSSLKKPMPTMSRGRFIRDASLAAAGIFLLGDLAGYLGSKKKEVADETKFSYVFDLNKEVGAMVHSPNHTTLTNEERDKFTAVIDAFDEITKAELEKSSTSLGILHLKKAFEAINNLPQQEQYTILGRLIYHTAHHHEKRVLLANIIANFPQSLHIGFAGGSAEAPDQTPIDIAKPVGIKNLLEYGRYFSDDKGNDLGAKYKISAWDAAQINALTNDIANFSKAKANVNGR